VEKNVNLINFYHFGHFLMSHDVISTKFINISTIGILSYFEGAFGHEGMVCQSRANAGFTQDQ
jgi:hypothetical protein